MSNQKPVIDESDISCPICFDELNKPTSLHCQHIFCLQCLKDLWNSNGGVLRCPTCREVTEKRPEELRQCLPMVKLIEARRAIEIRRISSQLPSIEELQRMQQESLKEVQVVTTESKRIERCLSNIEAKVLQALAAQWDRAEASLGALKRHHENRAKWAADMEQVKRAADQDVSACVNAESLGARPAPVEPAVQKVALHFDGEEQAAKLAEQFETRVAALLKINEAVADPSEFVLRNKLAAQLSSLTNLQARFNAVETKGAGSRSSSFFPAEMDFK